METECVKTQPWCLSLCFDLVSEVGPTVTDTMLSLYKWHMVCFGNGEESLHF